ncbi:MAG TPA: TonB-dependent receptor plug domain-containing protein, partial [Bacteroidales bacterium]|nr:TonB-dependent receptor plug domain-containing protein [Bacteroidales bacterium]
MMQQQRLLKRGVLMVWISLLSFSSVFAQRITVKGTVRDASTNTEMPGVNVVVKGKATGVITDANGSYTIQVDNPADTLVFSFVGYVAQRIGVDGRTTIDVSMTEEVQKLDEVVVVGYGTQKKSDLTGAVSVVRTENLERIKSNDISRLLQGQASGVMVQSSGEPGAAPVVRIRGVGSFTNSNPLYVVDGVVIAEPQAFGGQFQGASPSGGIADFNPGDIESIQVLKDASATAIYGARGANGVIIITTKRGKKGDMQITYDGSYGVKQLNKFMEVTNRKQFQEMNNLARLNDDLFL